MTSTSEDETFAKWRNIPSSIIADAADGEAHLPAAIRPLRPAGEQPYLFGRAVTVQCAPTGIAIVVQAIATLQPGDVLVLAADGSDTGSMCGDIFAGAARQAGCVGLVCDGAIRDVGAMAKWEDFSVFARSITPRAGAFEGGGGVNVPVKIGRKIINPGDLIVGDDDGVVALGPDDAKRLLPWALDKIQLEKKWIKAIQEGASVLDVFGVSEV